MERYLGYSSLQDDSSVYIYEKGFEEILHTQKKKKKKFEIKIFFINRLLVLTIKLFCPSSVADTSIICGKPYDFIDSLF